MPKCFPVVLVHMLFVTRGADVADVECPYLLSVSRSLQRSLYVSLVTDTVLLLSDYPQVNVSGQCILRSAISSNWCLPGFRCWCDASGMYMLLHQLTSSCVLCALKLLKVLAMYWLARHVTPCHVAKAYAWHGAQLLIWLLLCQCDTA